MLYFEFVISLYHITLESRMINKENGL
uniref:Uncharacterized protein n=1 Tax=Arundo donax TaxID=35708 RepID=A0A0A9FHG1_ARUDO